MIQKITTLIVALLFSTGLSAQKISSKNSQVTFEISNMAFMTVEGSFTGLNGEVNLDVKDPSFSSLNICLDATSINTENVDRDTHLNQDDFFDTKKYPTICFSGESFKKVDANHWEVKGWLTVKDIKKEITVKLTTTGKQISGNFVILRKEYGVGMDFNSFTVGNEVELKVLLMMP
jgi:polyisoprenoid-binding protein YceI